MILKFLNFNNVNLQSKTCHEYSELSNISNIPSPVPGIYFILAKNPCEPKY